MRTMAAAFVVHMKRMTEQPSVVSAERRSIALPLRGPETLNFGGAHVIALFMLGAAACTHEPPAKQVAMQADAASGTVLVEILVSRTGGDDYWRYRSTPSTGEVARVDAGRYAEGVWLTPNPPTGQTTCTRGAVRAPSADGRFVVECSDPDGRQARLIVKDQEKVVYSWSPRAWRGVDGFAWSPGSRAIALLNHSSRASVWWGPWDLFGGLTGHPVAHNTYYLLVVALEPPESVEYVIRTHVREGYGASILDWSR